MNLPTIDTLVLPVAGRGVRLQPLTTNTPKALVLLQGKPLIDYFLNEAVQSGIRNVILIVSPDFREQFAHYLKEATLRFPTLTCYIREQTKPWGHGRAILAAYDLLKGKPFIVRFSDDLIFEAEPVTLSLVHFYETYHQPMLLLQPVPLERASTYGVVGVASSITPTLHRLSEFVEKPVHPPSNLSVVGGYVLTPQLLEYLKTADATAPQVADGLLINASFCEELARGGSVLGWEFSGKRFDCGNLEGLNQAELFLEEKNAT